MNPLAERKRLLVLQGELQRQSIALEQMLLERRFEQARGSLHNHRWWVIGATIAAGWFTRKKAGGWWRWLPVATGLWRMMQNRQKE